jgi:hypothetical protein
MTTPALPLSEAAQKLGITPDALRMRWRRGKIGGFKRGRRVFIQLSDIAEQVTEHNDLKLDFLVAENSRLNEQVDRLLRLQEREQILRQQFQESLMSLRPPAATPPALSSDVLVRRIEKTEGQLAALKRAVGQLVAWLDKTQR